MYTSFQDRLQGLTRLGSGDISFSVRRGSYRSITLAELHVDLFSRYACPLEGAVFCCGGRRNNRERHKQPHQETGLVLAGTITTNTSSPKGQSVQQRGVE